MNFQLIDHSLTKKIENFPGLRVHTPKLPEVKPEADAVEIDKPKQKRPSAKKAVAPAVETPPPTQKAVKNKRAVI
jgi:hypothetical protein